MAKKKSTPSASSHPGPLGFILPEDRTKKQEEAHERALARMPKFSIPGAALPKGVKVVLTDFWKKPEVVADIGFEFDGFHQLTGSCFPAGTPVLMADGSEKPVEALAAGDSVITHLGRARPVVRTTARKYTGRMAGLSVRGVEGPLVCTGDHRILTACAPGQAPDSAAETGREWLPAEDFVPGRFVYTKEGYSAQVRAVKFRDEVNLPVYCCEVKEDSSFHARGLAVHNCVGASAGIVLCTLSCVQRMIADAPTKAFVPFWPVPYGRTRFHEGDRGQGEGAVDSVMFQTLMEEGYMDITQPGLPTFDRSDGLTLTSKLELQYSDGASALCTKWLTVEKAYRLGTAAVASGPEDIAVGIVNGYPSLGGCSMYIGNGGIKGSGDAAYVSGRFDGRGGHCLSGDTKIPLLDGTEMTIRELAEVGKRIWVYSYDHGSGKVIPKECTARMTRVTVPEGMVRVGLDNGESVTSTLDHRFMLRDGTYREAKDLRPGDSLMPLYRKLSESKRHPGYEMVLDPGSMAWELTHRRVAECETLACMRYLDGTLAAGELPVGVRPVIHHGDFNKRNNDPVNLLRMTSREHWRYHAYVADGVWDRMDAEVAKVRKAQMSAWVKAMWKDPEYRAMMREVSVKSARKMWEVILADPELYASQVKRGSEVLKEKWADPEWRAEKILRVKEMMSKPETKAKIAEHNRRRAKEPAYRKKVSEGTKRAWAELAAKARRVKAMTASRQTPEYRRKMAEAQRKRWSDAGLREKQAEAIRRCWEARKAAAPVNHKVTFVVFLPCENGPTYCLQVPGTRNFAVSAGVFVHNSTGFYGFWDHPNDGPLFLYGNNWPRGTYPKDPAGAGRCCVWTPLTEVQKIFTSFGGRGEYANLSHAAWFPAQPKILNWSEI